MSASADTYTGCDDMREWLKTQGFRFAIDSLRSPMNACNWYAYRPTALSARPCELNDTKRMQIVVHPSYFMDGGGPGWEHAEVDVTGEAGGVWFKLRAYSLRGVEFRERFDEIESRLIGAWNAILPAPAGVTAEVD